MSTQKVALVTGGGRGIGRAIALELARTGHDVAVGWVQGEATATAVAEEIRALGRRAATVQGDVAVPADCAAVVAATVAALVLLLSVLAVSPQIHADLHACGHDHSHFPAAPAGNPGSDDGCVVTLFGQGITAGAAPALNSRASSISPATPVALSTAPL